MTTNNAGITDEVSADINPEPVDLGDVKGPDPAQWDDPSGRNEPEYEDAPVKGPA